MIFECVLGITRTVKLERERESCSELEMGCLELGGRDGWMVEAWASKHYFQYLVLIRSCRSLSLHDSPLALNVMIDTG